MFLKLAHTKIDVFEVSRNLVLECYRVTGKFSAIERYCLVQQIRRASLSVHLNIAEGCSRRSITERKRFFEVARGSVIEIDAAIGIACDLKQVSPEEIQLLGNYLLNLFRQISALIKSIKPQAL